MIHCKNFFVFLMLILISKLNFLEKAYASQPELKAGPWSSYFQNRINNGPNDFVTKAFDFVSKEKNLIVIDLGAGAGSDIVDILKAGATVYAYDADSESIEILNKRFKTSVTKKNFISITCLLKRSPLCLRLI